MLLSYVMTVGDCKSVMMMLLASTTDSGLTSASTYVPRVDLTSKLGLLFHPSFMLATSPLTKVFFPSVSWTNALVPASVGALVMSHMTYNARTLVRDRELALEPSEYPFAVAQLWLKPSLFNAIKNVARRGRDAYTRI